ncbi:MAG: NAD-dependent epimerase/dehydratase family protein [Pseudomonadales bacterium]|nr:NAD-dependent epimerase/dehydratase family protein [Pseudomonadales bacterium]MCP5344134.1 NAD-dependent epimerase/dehydratase family protein [Pseudomonadales bacterium]
MQTPTTTVLVTGATGFIGRTLVQRLLERRCRVHTLSRQAPELGPDGGDCLGFQGDIGDAGVLDRACRGVDTVFHLAAYAHVNQHDTAAMRTINVEGTHTLLEAAIRNGVRRIVFFSSTLAQAAPEALTPYGQAKLDAEAILLEASEKGLIEVCCLRPVNVYGLGMKGNLLSMIRFMGRGWMPPLPTPSAALSLVGNRDLCEAALLAAWSPAASGQVYVVTDGKTYSFKGLEISVRKALGRQPARWQMPLEAFWLGFAGLELLSRVLRLPNAPGLRSYRVLSRDSVFSCEKIQQELGYNPAGSFNEELPGILQQLSTGSR